MIVKQHHVWLAAMRGDAATARVQARECRAAAERLDYAFYIDSVDLVGAWADAVDGDATGADRSEVVLDRYLGTGMRVFAPLYLLLCAEAHAACGHLSRAHQLIRESRSVRVERGEVCSSPRLLAWAAREVPEGA